MKENVISIKLSSFTKDKVKSLISTAEKNVIRDNQFALKCLNEAEYYIKNQYKHEEIFKGALLDLFGYGTGCPLLHLLKRDANNLLVFFFIKIGVNPAYNADYDNEFLSFA
ncbi:MAG: hypothetical protein HON23_07690 [Rickettsiales bacterium]|jgi:hypothetical protein|nr:hypothetical protein [Rickettsiales bacterium]